jgi:hypothetical protein
MTTTTTPLIGATMIARELDGVALVSEVDDATGRERLQFIATDSELFPALADVETLRALRALLNSAPVVALLEAA